MTQTQSSGQRTVSTSILTYLPRCTRQRPHQCLLGPGLHAHIHHPSHSNPKQQRHASERLPCPQPSWLQHQDTTSARHALPAAQNTSTTPATTCTQPQPAAAHPHRGIPHGRSLAAARKPHAQPQPFTHAAARTTAQQKLRLCRQQPLAAAAAVAAAGLAPACSRVLLSSATQSRSCTLREVVLHVHARVRILQRRELQEVCGAVHVRVELARVGEAQAVAHAGRVLHAHEVVVP